jgi:endonuclease/exonuclease/phosphatase family metal-dependent hydrolase
VGAILSTMSHRALPLTMLTLLLACNAEVTPPERLSVTVASIHLLDGALCDDDCRLTERVDLLMDWIEERGCPDVVALQQINEASAALLEARLGDPCAFTYALIHGDETWGDADEALLSRYPVVEVNLLDLHGETRHLLHARLDHPVGELDVFTTQLASSAEGGPDPCVGCPDECAEEGAQTLRDCQAVQVWQRTREHTAEIAVVAGDFREPAGSYPYELLTGHYWIDVYLDAGNPECDPGTGVGCTSGREHLDLTDLESPELGTTARTDHVFLSGPSADMCVLDGPGDDDGDGAATRLFADEPNPFADTCGPSPAAVCWPSDHVGVQVDIDCFEPTDAPMQHPEYMP